MPTLDHLLTATKNQEVGTIHAILQQPYPAEVILSHQNDIYFALQECCKTKTASSQTMAKMILEAKQLQSTLFPLLANDDNLILNLAIENNLNDVAISLLTIDSVKAKAHLHNLPLTNAAQNGNLPIMEALLTIEQVREHAHENKNAALMHAAGKGHLAAIKLLLGQENIRKKAASGKNAALAAAASGNHTTVMHLLLDIPSVREKVSIKNNRALTLAFDNSSFEAVILLLTLDEVKQVVLEDPAFIMTLGQHQQLLESIKPLILELEFYGFKVRDMVREKHFLELIQTPHSLAHFFEDPFQLMENLPDEAKSSLLIEAIKIIDVQSKVDQVEQAFKANSETAMSKRALNAAQVAYEKAQSLYGAAFTRLASACGDELAAISQTEQKIRSMILRHIKQETSDSILIDFINKNHDSLIQGTSLELMEQARTFFSSNQSAHTAWRAYDPNAPVCGHPNLFVSPKKKENIFAAGVQDGVDEVDIDIGSLDIRRRVVFYFFALEDLSIHEIIDKKTRETIFIGQIAEIMRAHNAKENKGMDSPSCYPGAIGRITTMGAGHPQLHVVNPVEEISNVFFTLLTQACRDELSEKPQTETEKEKVFLALTALNASTLAMLKKGEKLQFNLVTSNTSLSVDEVINIRKNIIKRIGTLDEVFTKINLEYQRRQPPIRALAPDEKVYVLRQLVDICFKEVGKKAADNFCPVFSQRVQKKTDRQDPFQVEKIKAQIASLQTKTGILSPPTFTSEEARLKHSLKFAECKNEIYQYLMPQIESLLIDVEKDALATFVAILAEKQFEQYTNIQDMHEKWASHREIDPLILEKANAAYQENPLASWQGLSDISNFAKSLKLQQLSTKVTNLRL